LIELSGCGLCGTVPPNSIFSLRSLRVLNLDGESLGSSPGLRGTLPADLSMATSLEEINLNGNALTGTVPSLSKLGKLQKLDLHYNKLNESLPELLPQSLTYISFANNDFSGTIPTSWSKLSNVAILGLAQNKLRGIVDMVSKLPKLEVLFLRNNSFVGKIPKLSNTIAVADFDHNNFVSIAEDICSPVAPPAFGNPGGCESDYPNQPFGTCCFSNNSFTSTPSNPCLKVMHV
jgi:Leucine-rich repeat (LRR) protein